jgi:uncharacterized protein (TIGR02466 family)
MYALIQSPFTIPFGAAQHVAPERMNAELRSLFLERERQGVQFANPKATMQINAGLYESRFDLFRWTEPCIRELREYCWGQLFQFVAEVNGYNQDFMSRVRGHADAWFHITRRGGYFGLHNHPMASWSGVYCVDPGIGDGGRKDSGLLSFPHPNSASAMFKDVANHALKLPYSHATREYQLRAGQLVIFPSWLMHQVTPFHGDGERITIAFNAWFQMDAPPP